VKLISDFLLNSSQIIYHLLEKRINSPMTVVADDYLMQSVHCSAFKLFLSMKASRYEVRKFSDAPQIISNGWNIDEKYFSMIPMLKLLLI